MVETDEIPPTTNEKSNSVDELVAKVARLANIQKFDINQIDVAHRVSRKENASIIVKFYKKHDRKNFYSQRSNFRKLHVNQLRTEEEIYPEYTGDPLDRN